jgi:hypothetical protein
VVVQVHFYFAFFQSVCFPSFLVDVQGVGIVGAPACLLVLVAELIWLKHLEFNLATNVKVYWRQGSYKAGNSDLYFVKNRRVVN